MWLEIEPHAKEGPTLSVDVAHKGSLPACSPLVVVWLKLGCCLCRILFSGCSLGTVGPHCIPTVPALPTPFSSFAFQLPPLLDNALCRFFHLLRCPLGLVLPTLKVGFPFHLSSSVSFINAERGCPPPAPGQPPSSESRFFTAPLEIPGHMRCTLRGGGCEAPQGMYIRARAQPAVSIFFSMALKLLMVLAAFLQNFALIPDFNFHSLKWRSLVLREGLSIPCFCFVFYVSTTTGNSFKCTEQNLLDRYQPALISKRLLLIEE